ncbi:MAG: hypothetical protein OXF02_02640 [Simkaniaceae bacterium]|nr:hypothetical protein [Simkaniaceae bacterium]
MWKHSIYAVMIVYFRPSRQPLSVVALFVSVLLSGCFATRTMTQEGFASLAPGTSLFEVQKRYGKPYAIHRDDEQGEVYEYVERIRFGEQIFEQRSYYIAFTNGKVVGKRVVRSTPPILESFYADEPYPDY